MKLNLGVLPVLLAILIAGCNDVKATQQTTKQADQLVKQKPVIYDKNDAVINEVFKDVAKIAPSDKPMIIIFGTNTAPYTDKLKSDINASTQLKEKLKNEFSSYYLKAHKNLNHKFYHDGEFMDVDTKTLLSIYAIDATPSIIFCDKRGKTILIVPGYMPPKQFLQTMNFIKSGIWEGKNRKNGEIYEALRQYYIKNGIDVTKKADR